MICIKIEINYLMTWANWETNWKMLSIYYFYNNRKDKDDLGKKLNNVQNDAKKANDVPKLKR
jgi:hypothetical protein